MEPLEIASRLKETFAEEVQEVVDGLGGQVGVILRRDRIMDVCRWLRDDESLQMNHLMSLCGVDYMGKREPRFEVVYNLYSIPLRHMIRIRAMVPEEDCRIASVTPIWRGANWHERETFDLFGIVFEGHPDLRRILLPEDWEGHPLRKDYPVAGPKKEWTGYEQVKQRARELSKYDFHQGMLRQEETEERSSGGIG